MTENSEYVLFATRFSVPLPKGRYADPADYKTEFNGMVSGIKVDQKTGEMAVGWQILTPPFNWDLGSTGKGPSSGWAFWTSYNSEMAHETLEANVDAGRARLRGRRELARGRAGSQGRQGHAVDGVPVHRSRPRFPASCTSCPFRSRRTASTPIRRAGGSPRRQAAAGRPACSTSRRSRRRSTAKAFDGDVRGVPVIKYEAVIEGEIPVGLGPLHTQYDGKGNAYTSLYVESAVAKWTLPPWNDAQKKDLNSVVIDKIPVHFNIGHLVVGGSDTSEPYGKYLVAMNKLSKGRHISVGPSQPESSQLIDITGKKMAMLYEAYTEPEPHFAQILKADAIKPIEVYPKAENTNPNAVWDASQAGVTRNGNKVEVKMVAIRSRFLPDRIDVKAGDEVTIHVTNVEQTTDMIHGLGIVEHDMNVVVDPGETKTVKFIAGKPGVYPFYCTNFCSALHQEMQGYLAVKP